jgi:hypothetical protein
VRSLPPLSIDAVPSLRLSYRRADVVAFWLLGVGLLFAVVFIAAAARGAASPLMWAAAAAVGALLPGLVRRRWFETGIWVWNGVIRRTSIVIRRYVSAVTYFSVIAAARLAGSALDLPALGTTRSGWLPRSRDIDDETTRADRIGWCGSVAVCVGRPEYRWALCLLPAVFLLLLFRDEFADSAPPSATYTLY